MVWITTLLNLEEQCWLTLNKNMTVDLHVIHLGAYVLSKLRSLCHDMKRKYAGVSSSTYWTFQLCSCTGHSQGCWKQVLHSKVMGEIGRWKTTEGGSEMKVWLSCNDIAILNEQKMQEAYRSLLPGDVVDGEEERMFYCKYINEVWK